MSTIRFALSTRASRDIGTILRDLLRWRVRNFLPVAGSRESVIDTSREIRNESVEEMLRSISTGFAPKLSNDNGERPVKTKSRELPCPFGDWPAELWVPCLRDGSSNHAEN